MSSNSGLKEVYSSDKGVTDPEGSKHEEEEIVGEVIDFGEKQDLKLVLRMNDNELMASANRQLGKD